MRFYLITLCLNFLTNQIIQNKIMIFNMDSSIKVLIFTLTIAALVFAAYGDEGGDKKMHMKHNFTCDGHPFKDSTLAQNGLEECFKKYAPADATDTMSQWKAVMSNTCFEVCHMMVKGSLDSKGVFNEEGSKEIAKALYPNDDIANQIAAAMKDCAKNEGADKALSMDNNCAAYKGFVKCVQDQHSKICKIQIPAA